MTKRVLIQGHYQRIAKGLVEVLTEKGCYRPKMKLEEMRAEIALHPDFKNKRTKLEHFIHNHGHAFLFIPKNHCELNPVERCWAQSVRYTRAYAKHPSIVCYYLHSKLFPAKLTIYVWLPTWKEGWS